jgi:hypothetical protein
VLEDKDKPSRVRLVLAVSVAGVVVAYFLVNRYLQG